MSLQNLITSCYLSKNNPQLSLRQKTWKFFPVPPSLKPDFTLFLLNDQLICLQNLQVDKPKINIYNSFANDWQVENIILPAKCSFVAHVDSEINHHLFFGRHFRSGVFKSVVVNFFFLNGVIKTSYSSESVHFPAQPLFCLKDKDFIYVIDKSQSQCPKRHFKYNLSVTSKLKLQQWNTNSCLLSKLAQTVFTKTINDSCISNFITDEFFKPFCLNYYYKLAELLSIKTESLNLNLISRVPEIRSLKINLPDFECQLTQKLESFFPFEEPTITTLSNGLILITGGQSQPACIGNPNCSLLKLSSKFDRETPIRPLEKEKIGSMLVINKKKKKTKEGFSAPDKSVSKNFLDIVDYLLQPCTPVVKIFK